jgi:hypothetical protein
MPPALSFTDRYGFELTDDASNSVDDCILPSGGAAPTVAGGTTGVNRNNVTFLDDEDEESETKEDEKNVEVTEDDDNETPEIEGVDSDDSDSEDDNEPPDETG